MVSATTSSTKVLGTPDARRGVFLRDTGTGRDAATFPWVSRCDVDRCNWAIASKSEGGAHARLTAHKNGEYGPCPYNAAGTGKLHNTFD